MRLTLKKLAIGQRASFTNCGFLTRSAEAEITLEGLWPDDLKTTWTAEAERIGWAVIDLSV